MLLKADQFWIRQLLAEQQSDCLNAHVSLAQVPKQKKKNSQLWNKSSNNINTEVIFIRISKENFV
jgi:hypothetical protein